MLLHPRECPYVGHWNKISVSLQRAALNEPIPMCDANAGASRLYLETKQGAAGGRFCLRLQILVVPSRRGLHPFVQRAKT